jgi:membrane protein DedA with SNARE-associated domain/rhodanese-related sulfurtransferase
MNDPTEILLAHGYMVLFVAVAAEQIGVPIPAGPVLIAAGALAGLHRMSLPGALLLAVAGCLFSDSVWYFLGRRRGGRILGFFCRVSLEPDTCVSNMQSFYSRYGPKSLLFAKFVPGLGALGPPMAGAVHLAEWKFFSLDAGGALAWSGTYFALGWIFRTQLKELGVRLAGFGAVVATVAAVALASYITYKYLQRRRIYRSLRIARISPLDLRKRMDAGEKLTIVDLRNPIEWREGWIPGSLKLVSDELDSMVPTLEPGDVVLYCSCPNEAGSARAALRLKRSGVRSVRPLDGGFTRWLELGFPVEIPGGEEAAAGESGSEPLPSCRATSKVPTV